MSTAPTFAEISENLAFLDDWEDRYRYLIELGQGLDRLAREERTEENRVRGCASQVWLVVEQQGTGPEARLVLRGESDAMIVQGLVAVLLALYSGRPAREIADTDAIATFDAMGLREHLTSQRVNGFVAMVERIRREAGALA